jgi:hypothetical protein
VGAIEEPDDDGAASVWLRALSGDDQMLCVGDDNSADDDGDDDDDEDGSSDANANDGDDCVDRGGNAEPHAEPNTNTCKLSSFCFYVHIFKYTSRCIVALKANERSDTS